MEGTVRDSCCWGTSGEGMEWEAAGGMLALMTAA